MMAETRAATHQRLGKLTEVPVGEGRTFVVGTEQVVVFRLRDGSVRAVSAVCPHAGGPIGDGQIDDRFVVCPLHQHTFDLATGCSTTGQPPLRTYRVRVDDSGHLVIDTSGEC